jgi:hypothetical protein
MAPIGSAGVSATLPRQGKAARPIASGVTPEYVWAAQLTTAGERGAVYGERMTPRRLALDAARLMLQQDLWGRATSSSGVFGKLTLLGSLCVAAGGNYREDGKPGSPDEPHAATVLATTCALLAGNFVGEPVHGAATAAALLDELCPETLEDSSVVQRLLATVHGVPSSAWR